MKYKSLIVTAPRVRFVDGVAEVDEETAEMLRGLDPELGVVVPEAPSARRRRSSPAKE